MIELMRHEATVETRGLNKETSYELRVDAIDSRLVGAAERLLVEIIKYQLASPAQTISNGETVEWGCGLLRFEKTTGANILEAFEKDFVDGVFKKGARSTLELWQQQRDVCEKNDAEFGPPRPSDFCVASADLLEPGNARGGVEGVRYPFANDNSGWWLFGASFDGVIEHMRRVELAGVIPRLGVGTKFLALPPGFAFCTDHGEDRIWFEEESSSRLPV